MIAFGATILLSAFLLFQVQPLIARFILPWFGGSPSVWTTCMLFFQVVLLGGYAYAHAATSRLARRTSVALHVVLLAASIGALPIIPSDRWKPLAGGSPPLEIIVLLAATVGGPYLVLSTSGPLLQKWFAWARPGCSPYRLFALSNFGSLLALVSYPFVFEPALRLETQAIAWSTAYGVFVVACAACGIAVWRLPAAAARRARDALLQPADVHAPSRAPQDAVGAIAVRSPSRRGPRSEVARWIGLAALPSVLLLAITSELCQEVAVVPFLWILPLALYLLSFIVCFERDRWYHRGAWLLTSLLFAVCAVICLFAGLELPLWVQIVGFSGALFSTAVGCHGELARSRPPAARLTAFYLAVAAGGALGGLFVVLAAPRLFTFHGELHLALVGSLLAVLAATWRDRASWGTARPPRILFGAASGTVLLIAIALIVHALWATGDVVERSRSFYGVLTVERNVDEVGEFLELRHGRVRHGIQYVAVEHRGRLTGYYGAETGIGVAIRAHPARSTAGKGGFRVAIVGLGVGTIAAYGRPGDEFRFYEINPDVLRLARERFTYIADSRATVDVVLGDARLGLERELASVGPRDYHVIAVDAFSSDSIPMHLATEECYALYWRHLAPDGVLTFHISNRYVDLRPVIWNLASAQGHRAVTVDWDPVGADDPAYDPGQSASRWILIAREPAILDAEMVRERTIDWPQTAQRGLAWSDDFSSLWQVLKR